MKIETDLVFTSTGHTACIHSQFAASSLYPLHLGCRIRPVSSAVDAAGVVYGANRALCDHYNQAWFSPRQLRGSVDAAAGTTSFTSDTRPSMLASCTFQPLTATRLATINRPGGTQVALHIHHKHHSFNPAWAVAWPQPDRAGPSATQSQEFAEHELHAMETVPKKRPISEARSIDTSRVKSKVRSLIKARDDLRLRTRKTS